MTSWREISPSEFGGWNERLLQERSASIRQYPLFNEGLRGSGGLWVSIPGRFASVIARARRWTTTPRYIVYDSADGSTIFACIVTIGAPGLRVGCILDGPVALNGSSIDVIAVRELVEWARCHDYIALRVTHSSEAFLDSLSAIGHADRGDGVPFYPHPTSELYVNLSADEATTLSRFQKIARQEIRYAREYGYELSTDCDPKALEKVWPVFETRSAQKGINYRNPETYTRMMREAEPHRVAHLYAAWREGKPVAAILILRDCTTAHYVLGAVDAGALGKAPSPACTLHWTAMRHAVEMGNTFYNLGTRSGSVFAFKSKFRPLEHEWPSPLTIPIRSGLYGGWRRVLPLVAKIVR